MLSMILVVIAVLAVVLAYKMGMKSGEAEGWETYKNNLNLLTEERNIANRRLMEVMKEKHLLEEKHGPLRPATESRWFPEEPKAERIDRVVSGNFCRRPSETVDQIMEKRRKKTSVRPTPPPPPPRVPASNFGGGHTTHHTHHDHLPGVVLGMAIHDALASSGDGCVVVPDYTNGPTQQGSSDVNLTERNSCVDSTPAYEAPSHSAPSYEPPSCSSSTDYSSGSTDYGCSDTSSSSSSFGD